MTIIQVVLCTAPPFFGLEVASQVASAQILLTLDSRCLGLNWCCGPPNPALQDEGTREGGFPLDLCYSLWVSELPSGQGGGRETKDIWKSSV